MFVRRCEILDFWHALEHPWEFAQLRYGEGSAQADGWVHALAQDLRAGKVQQVIARWKRLRPKTPELPQSLSVTSKGLLKSSDGGATWRNVLSSRALAIAINPQTTSTIYAGTDAGVAQSTDGGDSWTPIPGAPPNARLLALDSQNPNTIYAGGPILFSITLDPDAP